MGVMRVHRLLLALALLAALAPCRAQESVCVLDVQALGGDEQFTLSCLSGLANRAEPTLYLLYNDTDMLWIDYYRERFGIEHHRPASHWDALELLAPKYAKGLVVWDEDAPDTMNIAATYAGLENLLPVKAEAVPRWEQLGLTVKRDLRGRFAGMDKTQVYEWAFRNLWPQCNHALVAGLNVPTRLVVDLSPFQENGKPVFVRFQDSSKQDGDGAKLRAIEITQGTRTVVDFRVGDEAEPTYLHDADGSWLDHDGDRIADRDQYFTYRLNLGATPCTMRVDVIAGYECKVGTSPEGPWTVLGRQEGVGGAVRHLIRDYIVANKGFNFELSGSKNHPDERALRERILADMPPHGYVLGWHTGRDREWEHVTQASNHAQLVMCSLAANFSLHSKIKPTRPFRQKRTIKLDDIDLKPSKVYICFVLSDGDALHWVTRFQGKQWLMPQRGSVPFGWEIQPLLTDLAPGMLQYYHETATSNDCLVASASGIGYTYPPEIPPQRLAGYLRAGREGIRRAGLNTLTVLTTRPCDERIFAQYADILGGHVLGCIEGYAYTRGQPRTRNGLAWVPTALPRWDRFGIDQMKAGLEAIARSNPLRPLFVPIHVFCYRQTVADMAKLAGELDPRVYEVVRPDEFLAAYTQAFEDVVVAETIGDIAVVDGYTNAIKVRLRSNAPRERPVTATARVLGPQSKGQPSVSRGLVPPNGRLDMLIALPPRPAGTEEDPAKLAIEFSQGVLPRKQTVALQAAAKPGQLGQFSGRLIQVRVHEAEELNHRFGSLVRDDGAWNARAWRCRPEDGQGHCCFGPYEADLEPGKYLAAFRMKIDECSADAPVVTVDVAHAPELGRVVARSLRDSDFPTPGAYRAVYVPFERFDDGTMEYRVYSHAKTTLAVDRVTVYELRQP